MKKILRITAVSFVLFASFSFIGCGSTPKQEEPSVETPELQKTEETPAVVIDEEPETENPAEEIPLTETSDQETEEVPENTDENSDKSETEESNYSDVREEILEDIIEPEVFDAELPPLPEKTEEIEEIKPAVESEPVGEDEISELPELPEEEKKDDSDQENASDSADEVIPPVDSSETSRDDAGEISADEVEDIVIEENTTVEDEVEDIISEETTEAAAEEEKSIPEIIPSRSVSMKNGQSLDVEYPGKGWIFLGCTDGSKNLSSSGRKTKPDSTSFTLIARVPGTVILHFYKEDILADKYIDDYLEVTVSEIKSKSSVHVSAPLYSEAVPPKPEVHNIESTGTKETTDSESEDKESGIKAAEEVTVSPNAKTVSETKKTESEAKKEPAKAPVKETVPAVKAADSITVLSGEQYMANAKKARDEQNYTEMYNNLQNFLTVSETNRDEALFLLGQLYEGNSEYRNIKKSVETYEELTENYPLSVYWEDANKRVVYLKRFYINIR